MAILSVHWITSLILISYSGILYFAVISPLVFISDSEGDDIVISSDDELMEAVADSLSNPSGQLVRISVAESSGRPESSSGGRQGS